MIIAWIYVFIKGVFSWDILLYFPLFHAFIVCYLQRETSHIQPCGGGEAPFTQERQTRAYFPPFLCRNGLVFHCPKVSREFLFFLFVKESL